MGEPIDESRVVGEPIVIQDRQFHFLETKIRFLVNKNSFPRIVGNENLFPTYSIVTRPRVPPSQSCRNLRFSASGLSNFWRERHCSKSPVAKSRVVGEPIAESRVVGEPIVIQDRPLAILAKILEDSCYRPTKCTVTLLQNFAQAPFFSFWS